jgi:hypothetical protein
LRVLVLRLGGDALGGAAFDDAAAVEDEDLG